MEDMTMLWNAILTLAVGAFLWWIKGTNNSINVLRRDLRNHALEDAKTREHLAINYATKAEVNSEIGKILSRFDKLEAKLDRWMEKH
jgi:hypothetical protein|tara:strand:+ start:160 stop:420 length:261 start_codon:yes stop_codon:yes gene_type:complete